MKKVRLIRRLLKNSAQMPQAYVLEVEVIYAENISKEIFVKQRISKPDNKIDDAFAAVATPTQLEDLDVGSPSSDTNYFRDYKFTVYGSNEEFLNQVYNTVLDEVRMLIDNAEALEVLKDQDVVEVTSSSITQL